MVNSKTSAIPANEKTILRLIYIVSIVVFLAVAALGRMPKAESIPEWAKILPALNATLNAITTLLLLVSFYFIRKKNVQMHKKLNLTACVLSTIFLLSYITFHAFGVETSFPKDNPVRPFYLILLSTHIPWFKQPGVIAQENSQVVISGLAVCDHYWCNCLPDDFTALQILTK